MNGYSFRESGLHFSSLPLLSMMIMQLLKGKEFASEEQFFPVKV